MISMCLLFGSGLGIQITVEWSVLEAPLSTGRRGSVEALLQLLKLFPPAHRSLTGSPRSSSESHSPLYLHPPKCTSCGSQSPQHTEMCLHAAGPTFPEELGETQSEYSDSSCGESLPCPPSTPTSAAHGACVPILLMLLLLIGRSHCWEVHRHLNHASVFLLLIS